MLDADATVAIPPFAPTALDDLRAAHQTLSITFRANRTKDLAFRQRQIRRLYWGLHDCAPLIAEALMRDMGKSRYEAFISEIDWCKTECITVANKLAAWSRDEAVVDLPTHCRPFRMRIRHEPRGAILIIGAFNFPFQLNITPLIGAIAAGNTVVLKPSEHAPHAAMVIKKLFDDYLDPECYVCINGAVPETQALLDLKFDMIIFTGGKRTGALIAAKAAQSLTPVLLELGGLNPAFVTRHANLAIAARRLLWQKCINAGQICLSHNYVLIDRTLVSRFVDEVKLQYRKFMPHGARASPDFSHIINTTHFHRLKAMLDNSKGEIVMGGAVDEDSLFIEPTVVLVSDIDDPMMAEESFGPIWSIMPYDNLDEAIDIANRVDPTPLALFTFGSDEENNKVLSNVTSGGASVNDGFMHGMFNPTPFGGVGSSGVGSYHGYYSFRAFSHQRTIAQVPSWFDFALRARYMPYKASELTRFRMITQPKPNFDRDGNPVKGLWYWLSLVVGLGGKSSQAAALMWGLIAVVLAFLKLKRNSLEI